MTAAVVPPFAGVVLAGGRSRRMGADKATLLVDGCRAVDRQVERLQRVCDEVVVASGDGRRLGDLAVPQVADDPRDAGPLAGIVAAFGATTADRLAVLAVDLPTAAPSLLVRLAGLLGDADVALPVVAGRLQPLHAVWHRRTGPRIVAALRAGRRSVLDTVAACRTVVVGRDGWHDLDPVGAFAANVNRPTDRPG